MLGQAPSIVWQPQDISGGTVTFQPGQTYALLASADSSKSLDDIKNYVQGKGFQITYMCEPPSGCSRKQSSIDTWLAGITAAPRSGERWLYAEGTYTGSDPWSIDVTDSFPKTLIATYSVANLFLGTAAPPPQPAAVLCPGDPTPHPVGFVCPGNVQPAPASVTCPGDTNVYPAGYACPGPAPLPAEPKTPTVGGSAGSSSVLPYVAVAVGTVILGWTWWSAQRWSAQRRPTTSPW